MIQLKVINEDNFLDAFQLRLADGQEKYVSNPIRSLAQAYVYRKQCQPFGDSNRAMVVKQEKCYTSKARGCSTAIVFTRYILIEWLRRKKNQMITITSEIKSQLINWFVSQPAFIQALCPNFE